VYDDAPPFETTLYLVDLERDPGMMAHRSQLGARRGSSIEPLAIQHIRDGLDIDAVVKRKREPADVIPLQQRDTVVPR
jgi:hypothetical protein